MGYGWNDFDRDVVDGIRERRATHRLDTADGGLLCPLVGYTGQTIPWREGNYKKGTVTFGSPEVTFRVTPTFIYTDPLENFIVGRRLVSEARSGAWGKAETHRLGSENSEDAVSFNVFRSLQEAGELHRVAQLVLGAPVTEEPELFLWGRHILRNGTTEKWESLATARANIEPNHGQQTEPDIGLHVKGHGLILIEAKFAHGVKMARDNAERNRWLDLYPKFAPGLIDTAVCKGIRPSRFPEQILRNMVFAHTMRDGDSATVVALGLDQDRTPVAKLVRACLADPSIVAFKRLTWEDIYRALPESGLASLRSYYETKSRCLLKAFNV